MILRTGNERSMPLATWRIGISASILLLYGFQLTACIGNNGSEFTNSTTSAINVVDLNTTVLVSDNTLIAPNTVRDVNILRWLESKNPEDIPKASLAFLPGLAILCFFVALCFKCCGWFRENVKERHMDEGNRHMDEDSEYMIVNADDSDFMNVDFRSDTASSIYYDTVTSYYSFLRQNSGYDTLTSYRSLNAKIYDKRWNTDQSSRSILKKVPEMKDQGVQVNIGAVEGKRYKKANQSKNIVRSKQFGRFEVVPSKVTLETETTVPTATKPEAERIPVSKEHIMRCFSVGARSTPNSLRKLRKFKVSFDIDGNEDQYNTLPARSTFVVAADVEPNRNRMIKSLSRETILSTPVNRAMESAITTPTHSVREQKNVDIAKSSVEKNKNADEKKSVSLPTSLLNGTVYYFDSQSMNSDHYNSQPLHKTTETEHASSTDIPQSLYGLYNPTNIETRETNDSDDHTNENGQSNNQQHISCHAVSVEQTTSPTSASSSEYSLDGNLASDSSLNETCKRVLNNSQDTCAFITNGTSESSPEPSTPNIISKYATKHPEDSCYFSSPSPSSQSSVIIENAL